MTWYLLSDFDGDCSWTAGKAATRKGVHTDDRLDHHLQQYNKALNLWHDNISTVQLLALATISVCVAAWLTTFPLFTEEFNLCLRTDITAVSGGLSFLSACLTQCKQSAQTTQMDVRNLRRFFLVNLIATTTSRAMWLFTASLFGDVQGVLCRRSVPSGGWLFPTAACLGCST